MMKWPVAWRSLHFLLLVLLLSGCTQFSDGGGDEERDPHFVEGKKLLNQRDFSGAIESFERALQTNPKSAAAHFQLGALYETAAQDYAAAIYHYQRHLQLKPDSNMADVVKQHITASKLELLKTVSFAAVTREVQRDLERLTRTNNLYKEEIARLQASLAARPQYMTNFVTNTLIETQYVAEPTLAVDARERPRPQATTTQAAPVIRTDRKGAETLTRYSPPPSVSRGPIRHSIKPGETFAALSRRYNVSIDSIIAANPRVNPKKLQVGDLISVPAR